MDPDQIDPAHEGHVLKPDDGDYLRFERTLAHPPGEVWAALTDPDRNAAWLYRTEFEARAGGVMTMSDGAQGEVVEWDVPQVLAYAFDGPGGRWHVRVELAAVGDGTQLTFDHLSPDPNGPEYAAGWHWHLDRLATHLDGGALEDTQGDAHFDELLRLYTHAGG